MTDVNDRTNRDRYNLSPVGHKLYNKAKRAQDAMERRLQKQGSSCGMSTWTIIVNMEEGTTRVADLLRIHESEGY